MTDRLAEIRKRLEHVENQRVYSRMKLTTEEVRWLLARLAACELEREELFAKIQELFAEIHEKNAILHERYHLLAACEQERDTMTKLYESSQDHLSAAKARLAAAEEVLREIGQNAGSWHGDDAAKGRALAVIERIAQAAIAETPE